MIIETHAHLCDEKYNDVDAVISRAKNVGIGKIVEVSYDLKSCKQNVELLKKYPEFVLAFGIHPEEIQDYSTGFVKFVKENKQLCHAIGEIGLDYHYEGFDKEKQKQVFVAQMELAQELNLPIIVHSRDSIADVYECIKNNIDKLKNGVLLHCFSGSPEMAERFIKLGCYFGFGGLVTFKNAKSVLESLKVIPLDKIVLETDCPYMSPEPLRGTINEPCNIIYILDKIAEIKDITKNDLEIATTNNAIKFFKL